MTITSWAQAKEDIYLFRALREVHYELDNAFYIDVGAYDPDQDSVTKLFYDHGWHGINIEPSPKWFKRFTEERPRDINIQAAASDKAGELVFFDNLDGQLGTTVADFANAHTADSFSMEKITVKAVTLTEVCEVHAPKNIHFLKIDVEGAEGRVLRGMDFDRFRPWIMCIECCVPNHIELQCFDEWDHYVIGAGYHFVFTDQLNRYYIANERSALDVSFAVPLDDFISVRELHRRRELEDRVQSLEQDLAQIVDIAQRRR